MLLLRMVSFGTLRSKNFALQSAAFVPAMRNAQKQ